MGRVLKPTEGARITGYIVALERLCALVAAVSLARAPLLSVVHAQLQPLIGLDDQPGPARVEVLAHALREGLKRLYQSMAADEMAPPYPGIDCL